MAPDVLWPGMLIYIQEVFWMGDQGEGTSLSCTLYFSDFRTSFSSSLWLGEWDHFTRRTEAFQMVSNMYGYFFVHIILHGFSVNSRWWGEGEWCLYQVHRVDRQYRVWTPPVCCVLDAAVIYARDISCWFFRRAFCPLEGGRHAGSRFTLLKEFHWCVTIKVILTWYIHFWVNQPSLYWIFSGTFKLLSLPAHQQ